MSNKYLKLLYIAFGITFSAEFVHADYIVNDDLIIQGSECVGQDCVNGVDFEGNSMLLKKNNLRIRLHDTSAPDELGQSWNLSINDSGDSGRSYFQFELKSVAIDTIKISDGTALLYDCSVPVPLQTDRPPVIGVIPFGDPVTTPQNPMFNGSNWVFECLTVPFYTLKSILSLGTTADRGMTMGFDSQIEPGEVSIGNSGLLRNLKHVAAGISDTDMLIQQFINDYSALADQETQLTSLQSQLAQLDSEISIIEDRVFNNQAATAPELVSPLNNATDVTTPVTLRWNDSTDADGDTIQYTVTICEDQDFSDCTAEVMAVTSFSMVVAGLGGGTGLLWIGMILPNGRPRQRWMPITCLVLTAMLMASCTSGNGDPEVGTLSYEATGLTPGTQYFWKVTATDFIDSTDSEVRSFTTR